MPTITGRFQFASGDDNRVKSRQIREIKMPNRHFVAFGFEQDIFERFHGPILGCSSNGERDRRFSS
jgi:hypothetical protein